MVIRNARGERVSVDRFEDVEDEGREESWVLGRRKTDAEGLKGHDERSAGFLEEEDADIHTLWDYCYVLFLHCRSRFQEILRKAPLPTFNTPSETFFQPIILSSLSPHRVATWLCCPRLGS